MGRGIGRRIAKGREGKEFHGASCTHRCVFAWLVASPLLFAVVADGLMRSQIVRPSMQARLPGEPEGPPEKTKDRTPLHEAALFNTMKDSGHLKCIQLLLDNKANIQHPDRDGNTVLHFAAVNGSQEILQIVEEWGGLPALVNARNHKEEYPVHQAVQYGQAVARKSARGWCRIINDKFFRHMQPGALVDCFVMFAEQQPQLMPEFFSHTIGCSKAKRQWREACLAAMDTEGVDDGEDESDNDADEDADEAYLEGEGGGADLEKGITKDSQSDKESGKGRGDGQCGSKAMPNRAPSKLHVDLLASLLETAPNAVACVLDAVTTEPKVLNSVVPLPTICRALPLVNGRVHMTCDYQKATKWNQVQRQADAGQHYVVPPDSGKANASCHAERHQSACQQVVAAPLVYGVCVRGGARYRKECHSSPSAIVG